MRIKEGGYWKIAIAVCCEWPLDDRPHDRQSRSVMIAAESNSSPLFGEPDNVSTTP